MKTLFGLLSAILLSTATQAMAQVEQTITKSVEAVPVVEATQPPLNIVTNNIGLAYDKQLGFQDAASTLAYKIHDFHTLLLWIITAITLLVLALIIWIVVRYNDKANPVPATFTHNKFWERLWTIIPVLILIVIAIPSFRLMYYEGKTPEPDLTIKVTGYQWYWGYEYPEEEISFLSYMIPEKDINKDIGQVRLLSVDNPIVIPVDSTIQILTTAADVLHSFAIPAFGIKKDAVPGRLNETWFKATKIGTFYGQCSEICGTGHAYMPIQIQVVSQEDYGLWVEQAKLKFSSLDTDTPTQLVSLINTDQ